MKDIGKTSSAHLAATSEHARHRAPSLARRTTATELEHLHALAEDLPSRDTSKRSSSCVDGCSLPLPHNRCNPQGVIWDLAQREHMRLKRNDHRPFTLSAPVFL